MLLNLAEGTGRLSITDKRHFYVVSRSSLYEVVAILKLLQGQNLIPITVFNGLYDEAEQISKMLLAMIRK